MSDAPRRIYVACLASYSCGMLHGAWVDCTGKSADDLREDVAAILKSSPIKGAEEWAIHDNEGFGSLVEEYTPLDVIAAIEGVLDAGHGVGLRYLVQWGGYRAPEAIDKAAEVVWTDQEPAQYAEDHTGDSGGLEGVPAHILPFIDWEAMGHEWVTSGAIVKVDDPEKGEVLITNPFDL